MKVLIFGAGGQLSSDLVKTNPNHILALYTHAQADITQEKSVAAVIAQETPGLVINSAAFNRTGDCEQTPDVAFSINALGPQYIARACFKNGARFLHVSSDYVFDGQKRTPYVESDLARPLSVYGLSKFGGESLAMAEDPRAIVVRSSSLFGVAGSSNKGGNFVETILARAKANQPLEVVDDIVMAPTYTRDLAEVIWKIAAHKDAAGIYHAANAGACSWHAFAQAAVHLSGLTNVVQKSISTGKPQALKRAAYSALASERLASLGLGPLRPWKEALAAYLFEKGHVTQPIAV
jgi:dTDP-4-dehydrorhamnose reductase